MADVEKKVSPPFCPVTGAPMQRGLRPMTLRYKGAELTFDMPGWYCDQSDESIHTGEDLKISDRALNRLKARAENLPSPEEIRRIRQKLRLTQEQAGEWIGGGPRAFQKYEAGDLLPSRAIASALALLDRDGSGLAVLRQRADATRRLADDTPTQRRGAGRRSG
jgi:HTH-type transcriptional regulator / antitoxin MqsA